MTEHSIKTLSDYAITSDGRDIVLNFEDAAGSELTLKFSALLMERIFFEMGLAVTKARELSGLSDQGIVPLFRPTECRADLVAHGQTVALSFQTENGLSFHCGLEPESAAALAEQMFKAAERGKLAKPETRN
ncbi:MAG: hypothetical protein ACLP8A_06995 [Methylovirgula sp.]